MQPGSLGSLACGCHRLGPLLTLAQGDRARQNHLQSQNWTFPSAPAEAAPTPLPTAAAAIPTSPTCLTYASQLPPHNCCFSGPSSAHAQPPDWSRGRLRAGRPWAEHLTTGALVTCLHRGQSGAQETCSAWHCHPTPRWDRTHHRPGPAATPFSPSAQALSQVRLPYDLSPSPSPALTWRPDSTRGHFLDVAAVS